MRSAISLLGLAGAAVGLAGCGEDPIPEFQLVGVYDASAVLALPSGEEKKEEGEGPPEFLWQPARGMEDSCGRSKGAEGIGLHDATLMANKMTPTLAIVLQHTQDIDDYLEERQEAAKTRAREALGDAFNEEQWEKDWRTKEGSYRRRSSITAADVSLALGIDKGEYVMQPAVLPRNIAVRIDGDDTNIRYQQLVRTQMEVELCMEHKVGRGWIGNEGALLRQAFLLDKPEGVGRDRRYFGGQRDPVPPLMGPPDACIRVSESLKTATPSVDGKGNDASHLVPSDVWGASLRDCAPQEGLSQPVLDPTPVIPLHISETGDPQGRPRDAYWSDLVVEVGSGERDEDIKITVSYEDERLGEDWDPLLMEDEPLFSFVDEVDEDGRRKGGMTDLLSKIPHTYPTVGPRYDPDRYVVLLVPNWQVVEGIRRIFDRECEDTESRCVCRITELDGGETCLNDYGEECELSEEAREACDEQRELRNPMLSGGLGVQDGVGWVLEHPELLFIQVNLSDKGKDYAPNAFDELSKNVAQNWDNMVAQLRARLGLPPEDEAAAKKPNLAVVTQGGPMGVQDWGYTVGQTLGRSPVILPTAEVPTWIQSREAQRSQQHSYFLLAFGALFGFLLIGLRRLPDLWTRVPEERAYYWPGRQAQEEQEEVDPEGVEAAAEKNEG